MPPTRAWLLEELYKIDKAIIVADEETMKVMGDDSKSLAGIMHPNAEVAKLYSKSKVLEARQKDILKMLDTVKV